MIKHLKELSAWDVATVVAMAKKRRYLTVAVLSWITIGLLCVFFLLPQLGVLVSNISTVQAKEKELAAVKDRIAFLSSEPAQEIDRHLTVLRTALPETKPVLPLLASLERIAADSSVSVGNLELSPGNVATQAAEVKETDSQVQEDVKTAFEGVYALPLRFNMQGTFDNMTAFFKKLDTVVPLILVNTIQFSDTNESAPGTDQGQAIFRANVELDSIYRKVEAGDSSIPLTPLTERQKDILATLEEAAQKAQEDANRTIVPEAAGTRRENLFSTP